MTIAAIVEDVAEIEAAEEAIAAEGIAEIVEDTAEAETKDA